jgi:hypothetical protein
MSRNLSDRSLPIAQILTLLNAAPSRIAALSAGVDPEQLRTSLEGDGWSANDVLAHLRACADVWGGCMLTIISQDRPTLRAVNPRSWIKKTDYLEQEFQPSLQAFTKQRAELLAVLGALVPAAWSRAALVTGAGKPLERSVLSYAQRLASHERAHLKQIESIVTAPRISNDALST